MVWTRRSIRGWRSLMVYFDYRCHWQCRRFCSRIQQINASAIDVLYHAPYSNHSCRAPLELLFIVNPYHRLLVVDPYHQLFTFHLPPSTFHLPPSPSTQLHPARMAEKFPYIKILIRARSGHLWRQNDNHRYYHHTILIIHYHHDSSNR